MVFINQLVTGGSHIVTESLINRNKFGDRSAGLLKYLPVSQPSSIMSNKKHANIELRDVYCAKKNIC